MLRGTRRWGSDPAHPLIEDCLPNVGLLRLTETVNSTLAAGSGGEGEASWEVEEEGRGRGGRGGLAAATGLCTTSADTSDAKLRSFAEHYEHKQRVAEASLLVAGGKPENHRGAVNVLAPNQRDVPNLSTYSSISSSEALSGMSGLSCPA